MNHWLSEIGHDARTELIKSVVTGVVGGVVLQAHKLIALFKKSNSLSTRHLSNQSVTTLMKLHGPRPTRFSFSQTK
jgi:hypothetical protein